MRCKESLLFLSMILLLGLASASFQTGNPAYSINQKYNLGDELSGWVNISLSNQSHNSTFYDSFGNKISLQTILDKNPDYIYNESLQGDLKLISSDMQVLDLGETFVIPGILGELDYELNFSGTNLFDGTINVSSSKNLTLKVEAANAINNKKQEIDEFKEDLNSYTGFIKDKIDVTFNALDFEKKVSDLEGLYLVAETDSDYQSIIDQANAIKVPKSISETKSIESVKFYSEKENADLGVISQITGENYDSSKENSYYDGLFIWSQSDIDVRINFKEISASYGLEDEVLFSYFEVQFFKKPEVNSYLLIKDMDGLEFEESYNQKKIGDYYYINLGDINYKKIIFTTTSDVDFTTLPMFVSPALENLPNLGGDDIVDSRTKMKVSKWIFFGLLMVLLLVIGIVVYSIVSTWYDKRYENYLFPNKNNLYNLIIYINNSKRKGVNDDEIVKNLKKSKWSSEQIRYVMKKYAGKRTGMAKLPFKKTQNQKQLSQKRM